LVLQQPANAPGSFSGETNLALEKSNVYWNALHTFGRGCGPDSRHAISHYMGKNSAYRLLPDIGAVLI